jgi:hypothetical protein
VEVAPCGAARARFVLATTPQRGLIPLLLVSQKVGVPLRSLDLAESALADRLNRSRGRLRFALYGVAGLLDALRQRSRLRKPSLPLATISTVDAHLLLRFGVQATTFAARRVGRVL